jgi:hypothetical protein
MRNFLLFLFLIVGLSAANGQSLHWIELKDKPTGWAQTPISPQTLSNRRQLGLPAVQVTDQPVSAVYLVALQAQGVAPRTVSRWLNAVSATLTPAQVARLRQLPFVAAVRPFAGSFVAAQTTSPDTLTPERVLVQVNGEAFRQVHLTGRGVLIGVIDVGFYDVTRESSLQHLVAENRILDTRDFVNPRRACSLAIPKRIPIRTARKCCSALLATIRRPVSSTAWLRGLASAWPAPITAPAKRGWKKIIG